MFKQLNTIKRLFIHTEHVRCKKIVSEKIVYKQYRIAVLKKRKKVPK